ncbi:MAG: efflux RND transporter periplasmic adaptor subunit [Gallionella sp.]|nr:efflux RND transporter periplasmic adaptor subunit [Gallionella sp.]
MSHKKTIFIVSICLMILAVAYVMNTGKPQSDSIVKGAKPALTVTTVQPESKVWPEQIMATGTVRAWQESIIGPEIGGLRLTEVMVNVGDRVKQGALLARFADEMALNGVRQQQAAVDDAKARFAEAQLNAKRSEQLKNQSFISEQEAQKFAMNAQIAEAQMKLAEAKLEAEKIKYGYTKVLAHDDGIISSRTATVGTVMQSGSEMFRLIRKGRMEWRAELPEQMLQQVRIGQKVSLHLAQAEMVAGMVARISPVIDAQTRNGTVYVELPPAKSIRAGMFAQGEFELGKSNALTVPQIAVVVRDGFSYVFRVEKDNRVEQVKVSTGRRHGDRIEITGGIKPDTVIVALGAGFLSGGDIVRIENQSLNTSEKNPVSQINRRG